MTTTLSAALAIALIVGILKPLIEARIGTAGSVHDALIRGLALVLGVGGFIVHDATLGGLSGGIVWADASNGLLAAVGAVATFHLLTADPWGAVTPPGETPQVVVRSPIQSSAPGPPVAPTTHDATVQ